MENEPISLYGRNAISGTYEFFRELLYSGSFKQAVRPQIDSEALVQQVANDKFAIGYSGIGYKTAGVRAVPVAATVGDAFLGTCRKQSGRRQT
jgi:phosphate transport system substrate-binding protein